jgi:glycine/D-amino acid oxidase-like deaminating enzyme
MLWAEVGERLYAETGTLVLDTASDGWANASAEALIASGFPVRWLERGELEKRFPLLEAEGVARAFQLPTGGVLLAGRIVAALVRHLSAQGARIHERTRVAEIDASRARVVLDDRRVVDADALVVAAGAWVTRLLPQLEARLTASRQVVVYLEPPTATAAQWAASHLVLDIGPDTGFYLVPPVLGTGLKVGDHRFTLSGDPDAPREATQAEARAILERCRGRIRDLDRYRLASARVCFYTVEAQERFVVVPLEKAWVVSACSGHGFKFGPAIGLAVAQGLAGRREPGELTAWATGES